MAPTFGLPGTVVWDMETAGGPLPSGVTPPRPPRTLDETVAIECTTAEARAMERWLDAHAVTADAPALYRKCSELIRRALEGRRMNPSGANAPPAKITAVLEYLGRHFPNAEIDHVPRPDNYADLFRVIRRSEAVHQLLVTRTYFEAYDDAGELARRLESEGVAAALRRSDPGVAVVLT